MGVPDFGFRETVSLRNTGFIGEFTRTHEAAGHTVVDNTITGQAFVLSHSEFIVNCDDPMVDCAALHHILSDAASS